MGQTVIDNDTFLKWLYLYSTSDGSGGRQINATTAPGDGTGIYSTSVAGGRALKISLSGNSGVITSPFTPVDTSIAVGDTYQEAFEAAQGQITQLKQNVFKITYFEAVSAATGTVTKPTGSTILLDQFAGGVDAYVSTIVNGQPTGIFPKTAGGVSIDVTSFDVSGNYTLSGTPSAYPVAIIYMISITAADLNNATVTNRLDLEDLGKLSSVLTNTHIFVGNANNVATDVAMSGDATMANTGAITIANDAVTFAKMQNITTARLLGRATAGSGDMEEITLGSGLSFSGTTLNSTGGTVTTVSVTTNQGVSGSVLNPTTTPAITLSLGALTGVTSVNGLVITANTGVITTGTWNGSVIPLAYGGTNANLTAANGAIVYSNTTAHAHTAVGSAGQLLQSTGASAPGWTTPTYPSSVTGAGTFIRSDGTNFVGSTLTIPNTLAANLVPYATSSNTLGSSTSFFYNGTTFKVGSTTVVKAATEEISGQTNIVAALGATFMSWTDSGTSAYRCLINLASSTADLQAFRATGTNGAESFSETFRVTNSAGDMGIGTGATVSARLHLIKTTEQLRVGYDASNYYSTTVSSAGAVTFDAVGASAGFTFSDSITLSTKDIITDTTTGTKIATGATQKLGFWNATPVVQPASTGTTTAGFTANASANTVYAESTFTGNTGSTAYTVSDIIKNLKTAGILAS